MQSSPYDFALIQKGVFYCSIEKHDNLWVNVWYETAVDAVLYWLHAIHIYIHNQ